MDIWRIYYEHWGRESASIRKRHHSATLLRNRLYQVPYNEDDVDDWMRDDVRDCMEMIGIYAEYLLYGRDDVYTVFRTTEGMLDIDDFEVFDDVDDTIEGFRNVQSIVCLGASDKWRGALMKKQLDI